MQYRSKLNRIIILLIILFSISMVFLEVLVGSSSSGETIMSIVTSFVPMVVIITIMSVFSRMRGKLTGSQNNNNFSNLFGNIFGNTDGSVSKFKNNLKTGGSVLPNNSTSQNINSFSTQSNFSQKAQPTKIGNGIDSGLVKKVLGFAIAIIVLIAFLGIIYYILVNYLGLSINIG